jgi:peptidyl-prolyl cis-trans isomerase C
MIRAGLAPVVLYALSGLLLAACEPAAKPTSQPEPAPVAMLDGQPLSSALLDQLARQQAGDPNPYDPPAAPAPTASASPGERQHLLDQLVDIELLARKARERGLDQDPAIQAESALQAKTLLAQAMVREQIAGLAVSDTELAAAYEERVPAHQFQVAHIVLPDAASAQRILERLQQGQRFAELARRHSIDQDTRKQGGTIGWLMFDQLAPELATAVRHLKPGEHAGRAVQTTQGWHVVQLLALRPLAERPTRETAKAWLYPQILHAKVQAQQAQWRKEADVRLEPSP